MIALLSHAQGEEATTRVMDWLHHLGAAHRRINADDLDGDIAFAAELRGCEVSLELELGEEGVLRGAEVDAAWFRRWHPFRSLDAWREMEPARAGHDVHGFLAREAAALAGVVEEALAGAEWLTRGDQLSVRKFAVLRRAAEAGLEVPPTLVTNRRERLERFRRANGRIVCKPLREAEFFVLDGRPYSTLTAEVTEEVLASLPERFFPTLVQQRLEKAYELRVFHLAGRCWAMAILSQPNPQTRDDFRRYDLRRPNRCVPFRLPEAVEERCRGLMERLGLPTGSLDLVRTTDGRYVFLEVNPVGQFGMVSDPCNYHLERHVAEHLISLAGDGEP